MPATHDVRLAARWLCALWLVALPPAVAADYPRGQLPQDIVPQRYALTLTVDPRQQGFAGVAEIRVQIARPTQQIWLHGLGLRVATASLRVAGRTLPLVYTEVDTTSGVARLDLPEMAPAGPATLRLAYTADYRKGAEGLSRVVVGDDSYVFTQMEPIDARRAFPGFDDPQFKTPFELSVIAPITDKVVANAPLVSSTAVGRGLILHRFAPTLPLPTYLIALAVGPLDVVEGKPIPARSLRRAPIPLRAVATRGQGVKLQYALAHTPEIVLALEDYFGIPFPYPKLDLIASPDMGGAMENAGAIIFSDELLLLGDDAPPAQLRNFYEVGAHEIAHHWFGDLVTPRWWNDIWLNESFAEWMGLKIANQLRPDLSPPTSITQEALSAMATDSQSAGRPIRQPIEDNTDIGSTFDSITYQKGGGVLSMIESYIGPDAFRRGVRLHLQRHRHSTATADQFFEAMATAAGQPDVIAAFRSFVTQPGLPLVAIRRASPRQLAITQSRYAPVGSTLAQSQLWKIPLCVQFYGERGTRKSCTLMSTAAASMPIPADIGRLEAIMPNAGGAGYYRFALDDAESAALLTRAATLPDREALVLADSISGSFNAGRASLRTMISGAAALAGHPNRQVATQLGFDLLDVHDRMLDAQQRPLLRTKLGEIYGPQLQAVGAALDARSNAADPPDLRLRRRALVYLVGLGAREPMLRARLAEAAVRSMTDPQALDSGLRDRAWSVAAQEQAPGVVDFLATTLVGSDALARGQAAVALGLATDPRVAERARQLAIDPRVPSSEAMGLVGTQLGAPDTRAEAWGWMQQNFDALGARLPGFVKPFIFQMLQSFCDPQSREQVKAFGEGKARQIGTGELEVARAVEAIDLCVALKAQHQSEFAELSNR